MTKRPASSQCLKFLVVDDNQENLYLLQSILQGHGHEVAVAEHGEEALRKARVDPPDIVISDILMPVMDGFRLCGEWKADPVLKQIPFVFYTATYTHDNDQHLAENLGADLFIRKPQEPDKILEEVLPLLNKEWQQRLPLVEPGAIDTSLRKDYTEVLVRKLENKIEELEETRLQLTKELVERKRAEESLKASEAKFRAVVEDQTDFIVRWRPDGVRTFVNRSYCDYFKISPEAAVGTSFFHKMGKSGLDRVKARIAVLTPANPVNKEEHEVNRPDGSIGWNEWTDRAIFDDAGQLIEYQSVGRDVTGRKQAEKKAQEALEEIRRLKEKVEAENVYLKTEVRTISQSHSIVGRSDAMKSVLKQTEQVAPTDTTVMILGETGTGKELLARAIHRMSPRKGKSLVTVNCAAMPETLVESELFGREKGAFTGANVRQAGRFEVADGSTLFLDEIGELPLTMQAKILRVLQEGQFERLGSSSTITVDVRIIAATNRDLDKEVREGRFREDLFYRLNVFPIQLPPLRERPEDIPAMVWTFVEEFCGKMGKRIESIPEGDMASLQAYSWPGNIRELRNLIERSMIQSAQRTLSISVPNRTSSMESTGRSLVEVECRHIFDVLERTRWRIRGKRGAAEILGLKPTTLESRMRKLGIQRPE